MFVESLTWYFIFLYDDQLRFN